MNENLNKTLQSVETEDWLDLHVVRPFCYYWAVLFAKLDIHPNTVTILSMFIGAASAIFFGCGSFYYSGTWGLVMNIIPLVVIAVLLTLTLMGIAACAGCMMMASQAAAVI